MSASIAVPTAAAGGASSVTSFPAAVASLPSPATTPFLVGIPETLRLLGNMAPRSYQRMRTSGLFAPKAIKLGGRIYHRLEELKAWTLAGCPPAARWEWQ